MMDRLPAVNAAYTAMAEGSVNGVYKVNSCGSGEFGKQPLARNVHRTFDANFRFRRQVVKLVLKLVSAAALATVCSAPSYAAPYILDYSGTMSGTNSPFTAVLNLDLASDGAVATFVSGTRNGVAITGLSTYAAADNKLSFANPFVDFGGLSYAITGGETFNFYANNGAYFEANSVADPSGSNAAVSSNVTFASVNGATVTGAVPEPATWAMMMVGFGMIGFGLRRRSKVSTTVRFA